MQGTTTELLLVPVLDNAFRVLLRHRDGLFIPQPRPAQKPGRPRTEARSRHPALADRYDELLSTILVGNNIVNIALASVGAVMFVRWLGDAGDGRINGRCDRVCADLRRNLAKSLAKEVRSALPWRCIRSSGCL